MISGDKKGQVAVWDFEKVHERTVHHINRALTNTIRCLRGGDGMSACAAAADGTVKIFDLETVSSAGPGLDARRLCSWSSSADRVPNALVRGLTWCLLPRRAVQMSS